MLLTTLSAPHHNQNIFSLIDLNSVRKSIIIQESDSIWKLINNVDLITALIVALILAAVGGVWKFALPKIKYRYAWGLDFIDPMILNEIIPRKENFIPNSIFQKSQKIQGGYYQILRNLFEEASPKLILITAPTGIGKTTFLSNLFFDANKIPFSEKKGYTAFGRIFEQKTDRIIDKLIASGHAKDTVLLLDALDEYIDSTRSNDPELYWKAFIKSFENFILNKGLEFKRIIITVREQFLSSHELENFRFSDGLKTVIPSKITLLPFDEKESGNYLRNASVIWAGIL